MESNGEVYSVSRGRISLIFIKNVKIVLTFSA